LPKTRPTESRDAKIIEILEVAEQRLRDGGYEALSVAAIARQLGLAQNTIYWYFPSKDELFVATMRRMLEQITARKPSKQVGKVEQILWFTDQFQVLSHLRGAISERARKSPVVADSMRCSRGCSPTHSPIRSRPRSCRSPSKLSVRPSKEPSSKGSTNAPGEKYSPSRSSD
jgi:hypothetical protein